MYGHTNHENTLLISHSSSTVLQWQNRCWIELSCLPTTKVPPPPPSLDVLGEGGYAAMTSIYYLVGPTPYDLLNASQQREKPKSCVKKSKTSRDKAGSAVARGYPPLSINQSTTARGGSIETRYICQQRHRKHGTKHTRSTWYDIQNSSFKKYASICSAWRGLARPALSPLEKQRLTKWLVLAKLQIMLDMKKYKTVQ